MSTALVFPAVSYAKQARKEKSESLLLRTIQGETPRGTYGKSFNAGETSDWGLDIEINTDIGIGYKASFFWLLANNENFIAMNPFAFFEVASHNWVTIRTPLAHISLNINLIPFRFIPIDY